MPADKVALVDDDEIYMQTYAQFMKLEGFDVACFRTPRSFLDELETPGVSGFKVIICDLMMPWGNAFSSDETDQGMLTGLRLVEAIRVKGLSAPIIIFTNLNLETRMKQLVTEAAKLKDVFVLQKHDAPPDRFARAVQGLLERGTLSEQQQGALGQFFDSLILEPKIAGLGVNIKKLFAIKWRKPRSS